MKSVDNFYPPKQDSVEIIKTLNESVLMLSKEREIAKDIIRRWATTSVITDDYFLDTANTLRTESAEFLKRNS